MSMTNAQAALIAAANASVRGSAVPVGPVLKRAEEYLEWLEAHDATDDTPGPVLSQQKHTIKQCTAVSRMFAARCLLAEHGPEVEHRNSAEGIHWTDEEQVHAHRLDQGGPYEPPVHFRASDRALRTTCGKPFEYGVMSTLTIGAVTCRQCKEELGL